MTTCILCNQDAELTCEACNERFCSEEHMKLHINVSTGECFPFKIKETEGVGRYKSFFRMKNGSTFLYIYDFNVKIHSNETFT